MDKIILYEAGSLIKGKDDVMNRNSGLIKELIAETTLADIQESKKPIVEITGIEAFAALGDYAKGEELYFPTVENIIAPARNRRIKKEYTGYNEKELAKKYELTIKQVINILKDVPHPAQINMFDLLSE